MNPRNAASHRIVLCWNAEAVAVHVVVDQNFSRNRKRGRMRLGRGNSVRLPGHKILEAIKRPYDENMGRWRIGPIGQKHLEGLILPA
jgi:hypothetical protein